MQRILLLLVLCMAGLYGQPTAPTYARQADCYFTFQFSAALNTSPGSDGFDNRFAGCKTWAVSYTSSGFTVVSLTFQHAPDSSGSPGAWATFGGTTIVGVNPLVATTQAAYTGYGYFPWIRVILSSVTGTGTIKGTVLGWKEQAAPAGNASGGVVTGSFATQVTPADANSNTLFASKLNTAGDPAYLGVLNFLYNGSTWDRQFYCTSRAAINLTASGNTQIIAASGSTIIRVCHISMSGDTSVNVKFTQGTGANCATGTTDLTGLYYNSNAMALDFTPAAAMRTAASQALCVNLSGTANWGGQVIYAQF